MNGDRYQNGAGDGNAGDGDGDSEGRRPRRPRHFQTVYCLDPETLELVPLPWYGYPFTGGEPPLDEGSPPQRPHSVIDDSALYRQMRMLNIGNGAGGGDAATTSRPADCPPYSRPSVHSTGLQSPVPSHRHRSEYQRPNGTGSLFLESAGESDEISPSWTNINGHNYSPRVQSAASPRQSALSLDSLNTLNSLWHSGGYSSSGPSSPQGTAYTCLWSLRGRILDYARHRECCKLLQRTIEQGLDEEEVQILFREIKYHLVDLMTHRYANYIVQQFLEVCSEQQMNFVVTELTAGGIPPIAHIAFDQQGTRVVQKLLETASTQPQRLRLSRAIFPYAVELSKSSHGQHVILHCLENFSDKDNELLYSVVANNCCDMASDQLGCCVLQKCVESAGGNQSEMLVDAITAEASYLSTNKYGNYVVQHIVNLKMPGAIPGLISRLKGRFGVLSRDKFASHVVECCLKESGKKQFGMIVTDLLEDPNRMAVFLDEFGNYVFTTAVECSKRKGVDYIFRKLQAIIQQNAHVMSVHFYGSKAVARLESRRLLLPETVASLRGF